MPLWHETHFLLDEKHNKEMKEERDWEEKHWNVLRNNVNLILVLKWIIFGHPSAFSAAYHLLKGQDTNSYMSLPLKEGLVFQKKLSGKGKTRVLVNSKTGKKIWKNL